MELIREIKETDSDKLVIDLPEEFRDRKVEITIVPVDKKKTGKFSKEIKNFLELGGSGCWEGNLDEMRENRDGIG